MQSNAKNKRKQAHTSCLALAKFPPWPVLKLAVITQVHLIVKVSIREALGHHSRLFEILKVNEVVLVGLLDGKGRVRDGGRQVQSAAQGFPLAVASHLVEATVGRNQVVDYLQVQPLACQHVWPHRRSVVHVEGSQLGHELLVRLLVANGRNACKLVVG